MLDALAGMRVLELTSNITSGYVARQLGTMGADVLKVEPAAGDPLRRRGPFVREVPHQEGSTLFLFLNIGKRGITLESAKPTGRDIRSRLIASSDIVVWGGDPAEGHAIAQDCDGRTKLWVLVTPFGANGPHAGWGAQSVNIFHAGGEGYLLPGGMAWMAAPGREPIKGAGYIGEFSAGDSIVAGCMLALTSHLQEAHPQGAPPVVLDASTQEALLQLLRQEAWKGALDGEVVTRASRSFPIAGQLPALDGWVEMVPSTAAMLESLFELMGRPAWVERYPTDEDRRAHGAEITERIAEWTAQRRKLDLMFTAQRAGVPLGPVLGPAGVLEDPQLAERNFFVEIDHPHAGRLRYPLAPYQFVGEEGDRPRLTPLPAPLLGQHNVEVMESELGFSRREVVALYESGVI